MVTVPAHAVPALAHPARRRALSVAGGVLAALAGWAVEVPLLGVHLYVRFGSAAPHLVGAGEVAVVALAGGLAGWLLLAVLDKRTPRARAWWTGAALAALVASMALPLAAVTAAAAAGLVVLHVLVAMVVIPALRATARAR